MSTLKRVHAAIVSTTLQLHFSQGTFQAEVEAMMTLLVQSGATKRADSTTSHIK